MLQIGLGCVFPSVLQPFVIVLGPISSLLEGNEDGLQALDGAKVTADEMKAAGLSSREMTELMEKLSAPSIPDFELDVSQMVDADAMARKMYQAVPSSFE